jgi:hypothetical protein
VRRAIVLAVLTVLLAVGVASRASGPRGWRLQAATMAEEVTVTKRGPGKGKAHNGSVAPDGAGKVMRRREGPETIREIVEGVVHPDEAAKARAESLRKLDAQAEAGEVGDLIVELPEIVYVLPDGKEVRSRKRWVRHEVVTLAELARAFINIARTFQSDEAVMVGRVLGAVSDAIRSGDVDALKVPDAWARKRLRPSSEDIAHGAVANRFYAPTETSDGKPLDITWQISGGFDILADVIKEAITKTRRQEKSLDAEARAIATSMAYNFPALPSLSVAAKDDKEGRRFAEFNGKIRRVVDPGPEELRIIQIEERIGTQLRKLGADERMNPPKIAAGNIAEELLREEFRLSGKTKTETRRAFKFRSHTPKNP